MSSSIKKEETAVETIVEIHNSFLCAS